HFRFCILTAVLRVVVAGLGTAGVSSSREVPSARSATTSWQVPSSGSSLQFSSMEDSTKAGKRKLPECAVTTPVHRKEKLYYARYQIENYLHKNIWLRLPELSKAKPFLQIKGKVECAGSDPFYFALDHCLMFVPPAAALAIGSVPNSQSVRKRSDIWRQVNAAFLKETDSSNPLALSIECYEKTFYMAPTSSCVVTYGIHHRHPGKKEFLSEKKVIDMLREEYTMVTYSGSEHETEVTCARRTFWVLPNNLLKG
ncbi:hypothetical protein OTU49_008537, partial [Cherax quadricarinatus]